MEVQAGIGPRGTPSWDLTSGTSKTPVLVLVQVPVVSPEAPSYGCCRVRLGRLIRLIHPKGPQGSSFSTARLNFETEKLFPRKCG